MSASCQCPHSNLKLCRASGDQLDGSNVVVVRVQFQCMACGQKFRAVGVPHGCSIDAPSSLNGGEITTMPLVPVGEEPDMDTRELLAL